FDTQLVMPRFTIGELQGIADSSDKLRRSRGRRGLDILNKLRTNPKVDLQIFDRDLPEFAGQPVDMKLVLLAKHLSGKVVTNDYNLNKVAKLHGVGVINLNDLSNSLKPVYLPGESTEVRIVKPGEEAGQGIGYLDDGTMIVIEGGREHLNQMVRVAVTSVLQTSAGRMIFGKYDGQPSRQEATARA
ncbi:MAG TPA: TRAM domain-containing protein, partial [Pirellulales bacterium]